MEIAQILEVIGTVIGIVYVILEILKRPSMWILGLFLSAIYIYLFANEKLYASMLIQVYYFGMSFYGIYQWKKLHNKNKGNSGEDKLLLRKLSLKEGVISSIGAVVVFFPIWYLLQSYSKDPYPVLDSIIMALSVLGTYWLSRSYVQQWLVWIVADLLAVILYFIQGLYPTTILYFVYICAAVYGYYYWRKKGVLSK